jgi:flagellar motor protein MotB
MSRLFGELSGRRPGENQATAEEAKDAAPAPVPARLQAHQPPEPDAAPRPPIETALRQETEKLRAEVVRLKALVRERDQALLDREGEAQARAGELEAAAKRIAVLEDRQRQFAGKIRTAESDLASARRKAGEAGEALEYERQLRAADAGRLSDLESELAQSKGQLADARRAGTDLAQKLASEQRERAAESGGLRAELDRAREQQGLLETGRRELAARVRSLEPMLQTAQAEAKASGEAFAGAVEREAAAAARLAEMETRVKEESARRSALAGEVSSLSARFSTLEKQAADSAREAERASALDAELRAARERLAVLDDRQRQFAEKLRANDAEKQAWAAQVKSAREAFEGERRAHEATSLRLSGAESQLRQAEARHSESEVAAGAAAAAELAGVRKMLREAEDARSALVRSESELRARCEAMERDRTAAAGGLEDARREAGRLAAAIEGQAADGKAAREQADKAARAATESEARCRELERRALQAESDCSELRKRAAELEVAAASARAAVQGAGAGPGLAGGEGRASAGTGRAGPGRRPAGIPAGVGVAVLGVACVAAFVGGRLFAGKPAGSTSPEPAKDRAMPERAVAQPAAQPAPRPLPPIEWPSLRDPGVRVTSSADMRTVVFENGVFIRYTEIALAARDSLRVLAAQVKPCMGRLVLEIEGHTDSTALVGNPAYADNRALGQARAEAVLAFLRDDCGLPAASLVAVSAGGDRPPFPNDTAEDRSRNRTVVLRLKPAPAR